MASPSDRRKPRKSRGGWLTHLPLFRALSPGLPRPRPGRAAGVALGAGSGTDPACSRKHVRHRPGPVLPPHLHVAGRNRNPGPVAGLRLPEGKHAASGTTLATTSPLVPPHVRTPPPGHSLPPASKRSRSIRQRERTESGMELEGEDEMGGFFGEMAEILGAWRRLRTRRKITLPFKCGCTSGSALQTRTTNTYIIIGCEGKAFSNSLNVQKGQVMKKILPICFVSYCHDDADFKSIDAFEEEILKISRKRFSVLRDKKNIGAGGSISKHEQQINDSCIIIILLTPKYKEKVKNRSGGVYREFSMIMNRYYKYQNDLKSGKKVKTFSLIPILFSGNHNQSILNEITDSMYLDFTSFRANPNVSSFTISSYKEEFNSIRAQFENVYNGLDQNFIEEYDEWLKLLFFESKHDVLRKRYKYKDKEEVLNELFVKTKSYQGVINGESCILVGRKGSGKSTIVDHFHRDNTAEYKDPIQIIVDNFDLGYLYTFLYSERSGADIDDVAKITNYFEAVWYIFVLQQCALTLLSEDKAGRNRVNLSPYIDALEKIAPAEELKWSHFVRVCAEVKTHIDNAIQSARPDISFLGDIADKVSIPNIVSAIIGEDLSKDLRESIGLCQRKFIFALDGFDQRFEDFRSNSIASSLDESEKKRRLGFEVAWLKGLLRAVLDLRSADEIIQDKCDFCITIPQDRFLEVRDNEREDYRFRPITSNVQWSGVELSILLRKRLEGLSRKYETDRSLPPLERLEEIMISDDITIPSRIQMSQQGNVNTISTFKYLLRHTFWRPRDMMFYLAAILANQRTAKKRGVLIDEAVIKTIVSRTTYDVIETEFIKEYQNTIINIRDIIHEFEMNRIVLGYSEIENILRSHDFIIDGGANNIKGTISKIEYLFNIGFIGIVLENRMVRDGVYCRDSFIFSDGEKVFQSLSNSKKQSMDYVIHPIFVEYLMLDTNVGRIISYYSDDYLKKNDMMYG